LTMSERAVRRARRADPPDDLLTGEPALVEVAL